MIFKIVILQDKTSNNSLEYLIQDCVEGEVKEVEVVVIVVVLVVVVVVV